MATDEKEIFEFLDSLPTEGAEGSSAVVVEKGNGDDEILEFLDEIEGKTKKESTETKEEPKNEPKEEPREEVSDESKDTGAKGEAEEATGKTPTSDAAEVADPITSIASWWNRSGSTRVSQGITSLWGTAQSIGEQAEEKLKKAREQDLASTLKDLGIGEMGEMLDEDQISELKKLSKVDASKAIGTLNEGFSKGLSFFGGTLNEVIERIQTVQEKDESIEVLLVHDFQNFGWLGDVVRDSLEEVMSEQVDGNIEVRVIERGAKIDGNVDFFSMFHGSNVDAEKLINANIEKDIAREKTGKTQIVMSLLAWTTNDGKGSGEVEGDITIESDTSDSFTIMLLLKDGVHDITIRGNSQPLPLKWAHWMEEKRGEDEIDPSEWVIEWIRKSIVNAIGVVCQSYVIRRMGY